MRLSGSVLGYCSSCNARLPASDLRVVWGRVLCDACPDPSEREAQRKAHAAGRAWPSDAEQAELDRVTAEAPGV